MREWLGAVTTGGIVDYDEANDTFYLPPAHPATGCAGRAIWETDGRRQGVAIMVVLPFVGRAGALSDIDAALGAARASRGTLLMVTGEPGIGKSRLVLEAADRASGFGVVWSWCPPSATGAALRPWSQVVHTLASADAAVAQLVHDSPYLAGLTAGGQSHRGDPEGARSQLAFDLAELIAAAAVRRPMLVVIDDLHEADASSLWLLAELAPSLRGTPVIVLATARDGEQSWQGRLDARSALMRSGISIPLQPFGEGDVAALVTGATGGPPPPALVRTISDRSGGNPFLATELVRMLAHHGHDLPAIGGLVPDSVRAITATRLAELPESARRLVSAASVIGTRFRLDILAELMGVTLTGLHGPLADAHGGGLLESGGPGENCFRHDLVRDAIYDAIPAGTRETLHGRAGAVLASFADRRRDVDVAEVAYHLARAGPASAGAAADYARRAGDRGLAALAFEDAAQWYERADAHLAEVGADAASRAEASLALGGARLAAGDRPGARAAFLRAAERARQAGRHDLVAHAALGFGGGPAGFEVSLLDGEQIGLLEEARSALPEDQAAQMALVTARLSVAATLIEPESRRLELAYDAVRRARVAGDDAALGSALAALCDAIAGPDHCAARLAHAAEIIGLACRLRDPVLELLGRRLRLVALLETGAIADWDTEARAYRVTAEGLRHPLYLWYVPLWRGMRALADGRFADCRDALGEASAIGRRAGSGNADLLVVTQRWCLLAETNDAAGLDGLLQEIERADLGVWPQVSRALVLAQLGRADHCRAQMDAVAPLLASMPRDSEWLASLAQIAETLTVIGPHPVARWVYDAMSPYAQLFVVEGICAAVRGPVHRHLALLAAVLGDHAAAAAHFTAATDAVRRIGATHLAARIASEARLVGADRRPVRQEAGEPVQVGVFRRDGDIWTFHYEGCEIRLRDSKGLRDLAVLLARPGSAVAALDLATAHADGRVRGAVPRGLHAPSDTGALLDTHARDAYKRRLAELEEEAAEADAFGDAERSARIAAERDSLVAALTRAYGLGGRARRTGSPAERARTAVTARIKDAIRRIDALHAPLGRHLSRSVRTGTFCVYEPEKPVRWSL
ncbi:MAG: ATP-binding protein [Micromonosporaceae bacterium]